MEHACTRPPEVRALLGKQLAAVIRAHEPDHHLVATIIDLIGDKGSDGTSRDGQLIFAAINAPVRDFGIDVEGTGQPVHNASHAGPDSKSVPTPRLDADDLVSRLDFDSAVALNDLQCTPL
jgi:hypothetical protein